MSLHVDIVNIESRCDVTMRAVSSYHHGNLRQALVDAAVELGREKGPDGIVIREVARRTGVSHNAAYRHFADRDELLREVAGYGMDRAVGGDAPAGEAGARVDGSGRAGAAPAARGRQGVRRVRPRRARPLRRRRSTRSRSAISAVPTSTSPTRSTSASRSGSCAPEKRPGAELPCWAGVHGFSMLYGTGPMREVPRRQRDADLAQLLDRIDDSLRA